MNRLWLDKPLCGLLAGLVVLVSAGARASAPIGVEALSRFEDLPVLRPDAWVYQNSSYDRNGRNYDWTGILGTMGAGGSEKIILDVKGPGCVYRIWFTASTRPLSGTIRIYFDGSPVPTVQMSMEQFFGGSHPWFPSPLVGNHLASSGGYYSYVPMAFSSGCRITHNNPADLNYYNITYHRYPDATGITTFDGSQDTGSVVTMWTNVGQDPKADSGAAVSSGTVNVSGLGGAGLLSVSGAGIVQSIDLNLPAATQEILSTLRLRMVWDAPNSAAVDIPIGSFFGSGLAPRTVNALPVGMQGTRLYCYLPMPYATSASISLHNSGSTPVNAISYSVGYTAASAMHTPSRFHAIHNRQNTIPEGLDYNYVTLNGTGHLVGIVQNMRGLKAGQWYLEGDERFYVDGGLTPVLHGTGTEDFFNGGWYFEKGTFSLPLHGQPFHQGTSTTLNSDGCYRFFLGDLIPFRRFLRAGIEHGGWNEDPVDIESVAYYYRAPRNTLFMTDELDIADPDSEAAHNYTFSSQAWSGTTSAWYQGNSDGASAADQGRWLGLGGSSSFEINTYPTGRYVMLRRRMNYGVPRQEATVLVDGVVAGTWYDAGSSAANGSRNTSAPSFRDSEFLIPPALSQGKQRLQVEIHNASSESEWTEYRYQVFVLRDQSILAPDFDGDGDVDMEDYAYLQRCLSGPSIVQQDPYCEAARLDHDQDVDVADAQILIQCLSGPGEAADPDCAGQ